MIQFVKSGTKLRPIQKAKARIMPVQPFYLDLSDDEIKHLEGCLGEILRSGELILGRFTRSFENEFARHIGCKHAVCVNSGTSALEVLLRIHHAADKRVAVPTNTNFATPAAIIRAGGQPVWLDMTAETYMPNAELLDQTHRANPVAGVVWVHIGGLISPDFIEVEEYCRSKGLFLIEDAAHAHGSALNHRKAGTFGDGGAFSFFPTKVMTTMEGGIVTTNSDETAALVQSFRNQGKGASKFGGEHFHLGNSWRILEIAAAMGEVQLRKLDAMLERRETAAQAMRQALAKIGVGFCDSSHMTRASNYKLIVKIGSNVTIKELKDRFSRHGVVLGGGVYEKPCHLQPVFSNVPLPASGLDVATRLCPRHICPPLTSGMSDRDIETVVAAINHCLR